jgi:hypothetical protein
VEEVRDGMWVLEKGIGLLGEEVLRKTFFLSFCYLWTLMIVWKEEGVGDKQRLGSVTPVTLEVGTNDRVVKSAEE